MSKNNLRELADNSSLRGFVLGFFSGRTRRKEQITFLSREEEQNSNYPNYIWSNMIQGACISFGLPPDEAPVTVGCHSSGTNCSLLELD